MTALLNVCLFNGVMLVIFGAPPPPSLPFAPLLVTRARAAISAPPCAATRWAFALRVSDPGGV
jgi:hypothetical protein